MLVSNQNLDFATPSALSAVHSFRWAALCAHVGKAVTQSTIGQLRVLACGKLERMSGVFFASVRLVSRGPEYEWQSLTSAAIRFSSQDEL